MNNLKELEKILDFDEKNVKEKKNKVDTAHAFVEFYLLVNGILKKEDIFKILEYYKISLTKKEMGELFKKINMKENDKYACFLNLPNKGILDAIVKEKNRTSLRLFSIKEIVTYMIIYYSNMSLIGNLLGVSADEVTNVYLQNVIIQDSVEEEINILKMYFKIKKSVEKDLTKLLSKIQNQIRYWIYNGRTYDEYKFEIVIEEEILPTIPKEDSLKACLEKCSKKSLETFNIVYATEKKDELVDLIIKELEDSIDGWSKSYADEILSLHKKAVTEYLDIDDVFCGFIYFYKDGEETKYFIPKEIRDVIEKNYDNLEEGDEDEQFNFDDIFQDMPVGIGDLVIDYMNMNGVITRKKLQELLRNNHNVEISLKELDEIVKSNDFYVKKDIYEITKFDDKTIKNMFKAKEMFGKYRVRENNNMLFAEDRMLCELEDLVKTSKTGDSVEEIIRPILFSVKFGAFSKESFSTFMEEIPSLKDSFKNKVYEIVKKYKKDISVWMYNGYTIDEVNSMKQTKTKVGRNDPCPCGSGKKYKKCCGK